MSKYYEVIFEGDKEIIFGFLSGYTLGSGKKTFFDISDNVEVKGESLSMSIKEWLSLKNHAHHAIMEESFFQAVDSALKQNNILKDMGLSGIQSYREIVSGVFEFNATTYGRKYANEIKQIVENLPTTLKLEGYAPKEEVDKDGKGVELYSPDHEYSFTAEGKISGEIKDVIHIQKKMDEHPLIEAGKIQLFYKS